MLNGKKIITSNDIPKLKKTHPWRVFDKASWGKKDVKPIMPNSNYRMLPR